MIRLEDYVLAALEHAAASLHHPACQAGRAPQRKAYPVCECHVGKARFALSLYLYGKGKDGKQYAVLAGAPTGEEFKAAIGCADDQTWVLCRRSPRAVHQYGENAIYLSEKQYQAGELKALRTRMARMGVAEFGPDGRVVTAADLRERDYDAR